MNSRIKNLISAVLILIIMVLFSIALFNTFFKRDASSKLSDVGKVSDVDKSYDIEADPDYESFNPYDDTHEMSNTDIEDMMEADFIQDDVNENKVITHEYNGYTFSFGVNSDNDIGGLVLNPKVIDSTNKYYILCTSSTGIITANAVKKVHPYSEDFENTQYIFTDNTSLYGVNAEYRDDEQFGITWNSLPNTGDSAVINIKFMDYNSFEFIGSFDLYVSKANGKYVILTIEDSILPYEGNEAIYSKATYFKDQLDAWGMLTVDTVVAEEVDCSYYVETLAADGYTTLYRGRIDASNYPMYAITFTFKETDRSNITIYMRKNGELFGSSSFNYGKSLYYIESELGINSDSEATEDYEKIQESN